MITLIENADGLAHRSDMIGRMDGEIVDYRDGMPLYPVTPGRMESIGPGWGTLTVRLYVCPDPKQRGRA